jgi:chromosomal replication initiation ATPase DnaA
MKQFPLEKIAKIVCDTVGVDFCVLKERSRSNSISLSRSLFVFMARTYSYSSNNEIAKFLGRDPALITRLAGNFKIGDNLNLIEEVKVSLGVGKC